MLVRSPCAARATVLGLLAVVALSQGCASSARQTSVQAVGSLDSTRSELAEGVNQLDKVLETLNQLESKPEELAPAYRRYVSQVRGLESRARSATDRIRDMRVRAAEYSTQWSAANETLSNPELRAAAAERAERVRSKYAEIDAKAQEVRAAYTPLITELLDIETFLTQDLTYAGITSATPVFESAREKAAVVKSRVSELLIQLDQTYTRLSPTTTTTN